MQTSSLALASQLYMWEPANPRERADFEEDVIRSTDPNLFQAPLTCKQITAMNDDDSFVLDSLFQGDGFDRANTYRERIFAWDPEAP